jgi:hypothetical protein
MDQPRYNLEQSEMAAQQVPASIPGGVESESYNTVNSVQNTTNVLELAILANNSHGDMNQ